MNHHDFLEFAEEVEGVLAILRREEEEMAVARAAVIPNRGVPNFDGIAECQVILDLLMGERASLNQLVVRRQQGREKLELFIEIAVGNVTPRNQRSTLNRKCFYHCSTVFTFTVIFYSLLHSPCYLAKSNAGTHRKYFTRCFCR